MQKEHKEYKEYIELILRLPKSDIYMQCVTALFCSAYVELHAPRYDVINTCTDRWD